MKLAGYNLNNPANLPKAMALDAAVASLPLMSLAEADKHYKKEQQKKKWKRQRKKRQHVAV